MITKIYDTILGRPSLVWVACLQQAINDLNLCWLAVKKSRKKIPKCDDLVQDYGNSISNALELQFGSSV